MSDDKESILRRLVSYQEELKLLLEREESLSAEGSSDIVLEDKASYRRGLIEEMRSYSDKLIDLGVGFSVRKIDPRKL